MRKEYANIGSPFFLLPSYFRACISPSGIRIFFMLEYTDHAVASEFSSINRVLIEYKLRRFLLHSTDSSAFAYRRLHFHFFQTTCSAASSCSRTDCLLLSFAFSFFFEHAPLSAGRYLRCASIDFQMPRARRFCRCFPLLRILPSIQSALPFEQHI